jgi:hypothetical protein
MAWTIGKKRNVSVGHYSLFGQVRRIRWSKIREERRGEEREKKRRMATKNPPINVDLGGTLT